VCVCNELLINPIIQNRTRHISGVYHPIHITFWCQEVVMDLYMPHLDALAVVMTVNTRQLVSRTGRIGRIILFKSAPASYSAVQQKWDR
jgi:hypothetical protein